MCAKTGEAAGLPKCALSSRLVVVCCLLAALAEKKRKPAPPVSRKSSVTITLKYVKYAKIRKTH